MKELLEALTVVFHGVFIDWFPNFLKMTTGVMGEFLDTFGYAKAIIITIIGVIGITVRWIWKKLNR